MTIKIGKKLLFFMGCLLCIAIVFKYLETKDYYKIRHFRSNADIFGYDLLVRDDHTVRSEDRYFIALSRSPEGEMFLLKRFLGKDYKSSVIYLEGLGAECKPLEEYKYSKTTPKKKYALCYYESSFISSLMNFDLWAAFTFWHSFFIDIKLNQNKRVSGFSVNKYQDHF